MALLDGDLGANVVALASWIPVVPSKLRKAEQLERWCHKVDQEMAKAKDSQLGSVCTTLGW